uniref:NADH dehydrogenase subunit 6 n=1 Tax=Thetibates serena TaxID=2866982 RepID=UPI001EDE3CE6|nr:NADH dehydrogenase subunit 6 [Thetibates serena]UIG88151.1 NADH dehydrogenase subunit 6 [Thetibates serena]UIG88171.1 NADH dehydrogenase subunit 6 [Thetibates serena]
MKITLMLMMLWSTSIMLLNHPLSMGFNLIIQTLTMSIMMNIMMKYSWFSYMLVLMMLGGMLVLFMYMASIASNEIMKFSFKFTMLIMMTMMLLYFMTKNNLIMEKSTIMSMIENKNIESMMKMFNTKNSILTIMMALYLLLTMIMITYITNIHEGPMRKKN